MMESLWTGLVRFCSLSWAVRCHPVWPLQEVLVAWSSTNAPSEPEPWALPLFCERFLQHLRIRNFPLPSMNLVSGPQILSLFAPAPPLSRFSILWNGEREASAHLGASAPAPAFQAAPRKPCVREDEPALLSPAAPALPSSCPSVTSLHVHTGTFVGENQAIFSPASV